MELPKCELNELLLEMLGFPASTVFKKRLKSGKEFRERGLEISLRRFKREIIGKVKVVLRWPLRFLPGVKF